MNKQRGNKMKKENKGYKITIFSDGKFCWKFERTKGIEDDKGSIMVYWAVAFIFIYWVVAGIATWALSS